MSATEEQGAGKPVDSIQAYLSGYATGLRYEEFSADLVHAAKVRVIDTLGALAAGFDGDPCRIARAIAAGVPHTNGATVLGTRTRTTVDLAAFANATAARFPELTDTYHWPGSAYGHPSDVIMGILSAAENTHARGHDLIAAVVLGYEIYCRFSDALHNRGFDPSNFSCLAIALGAGKLMGLAPEKLSHAIALAVTPNVVLRQVRVDHLTMFKVAAAGQAARAGIFAAQLAQAGMEGPHLPFEGQAGWCRHVAGGQFELGAFGGKGDAFRLPVTGLKMRPCAGNTISPVLAAEKVATRGDSSKIERVKVEVYARAKVASGTGDHFWNPQTAETADHSIPYLVAVALIDGTVTLRSYDDARLWDPQVRELIRKVEVAANDEFTRAYERIPQSHHARVTITMKGGETSVAEAGGNDEELSSHKSDAQVEAKFRSLAEPVLGAERTDKALDMLWHLEQLEDTANIPASFVMQSAAA